MKKVSFTKAKKTGQAFVKYKGRTYGMPLKDIGGGSEKEPRVYTMTLDIPKTYTESEDVTKWYELGPATLDLLQYKGTCTCELQYGNESTTVAVPFSMESGYMTSYIQQLIEDTMYLVKITLHTTDSTAYIKMTGAALYEFGYDVHIKFTLTCTDFPNSAKASGELTPIDPTDEGWDSEIVLPGSMWYYDSKNNSVSISAYSTYDIDYIYIGDAYKAPMRFESPYGAADIIIGSSINKQIKDNYSLKNEPLYGFLEVSDKSLYNYGTAAPTTVPNFVGQYFIDTSNKKLYMAFGTTSASDWVPLN